MARRGPPRDPLLPGSGFLHEVRVSVGACFNGRGIAAAEFDPEVVPVRVGHAASQGHDHVPLLCSPLR